MPWAGGGALGIGHWRALAGTGCLEAGQSTETRRVVIERHATGFATNRRVLRLKIERFSFNAVRNI